MNYESVAVIGAISTLLIGVFMFIYRLWKDHTKLTRDVLEVIQRNATANERLSSTVVSLKDSTEKNTEATRQTRDTISQLMFAVIKKKP